MKVDFFNFNYVSHELKLQWKEAIDNCINSGSFIGGSIVEKFENEFAIQSGCAYAIGVSNGLDGLELGLRAMNIGKGDLVAVPAHTFIASWNAIIASGATPIGVDIDESAQIDLNHLENLMRRVRIACVMPVHMHGHVVNLQDLADLKSRYKFKVIEDASQAHFASRGSIKVGEISEVAVFSLYPTKNLGGLGDAGVLMTNEETINERVRKLANYGANPSHKYIHTELGFNRRLDSMQAAVLNVNLLYVKDWNATRVRLSKLYSRSFDQIDVKYLKGRSGSVWHHFCIFSERRKELREFLSSKGVGTEIHYPKLASNEVAEFMQLEKNYFSKAEEISRTILSIPLSQFHTEEMVEYVISVFKDAKNIGLV